MAENKIEHTRALLIGNDPNAKNSFLAHAVEKNIAFLSDDSVALTAEEICECISYLGGAVVVVLALRADRETGNLDTYWLDLALQLVSHSVPVLVTADTEHTPQVAGKGLPFVPGSDMTADKIVLDEVVRLGR